MNFYGFRKTCALRIPVNLLIIQGILVTLLTLLFLFLPSVTAGYWLLSALTAQLAVISYAGLFAALIVLRIKYPQRQGCFCIPGGLVGVCITSIIGLFACAAVFIIGFIPPAQINMGNVFAYEALISGGIIVFITPVYFLIKSR